MYIDIGKGGIKDFSKWGWEPRRGGLFEVGIHTLCELQKLSHDCQGFLIYAVDIIVSTGKARICFYVTLKGKNVAL